MGQYRVITLPACRISTYQPQPLICTPPSRSQPQLEPSGAVAPQRTVVTTPAEAAWIGVPLPTPRSTPWWLGRSAVRNPETTPPLTGATQPEAEISPGLVQRRSFWSPT